jgi:Ca2+/Na+ antiporter
MIWLAIVFGIFLFYKYVEIKHKVMFLKIIGVLTGAIVVLFFILFCKNESESKKNRIVPADK